MLPPPTPSRSDAEPQSPPTPPRPETVADEAQTGQWTPTPTGAEPVAPSPARVTPIPGYDILSELGRGGMGIVYKARHLKLKRLVALKMIRAGAEAGPEELARF